MFNSFAYNQGQSGKRIGFTYSGEAMYYTVTNNLSSVSRRSRTEFTTLGFAHASSNVEQRPSTTGYTGAIVFDRDDMMQYINWTVTGTTDSIVGTLDLSSQTQLRDNIQIVGHENLTAITFSNDINPTNKANSGITLMYVNQNDLKTVDLSGFKNLGSPTETCTLRVRNNTGLTSVVWPTPEHRVSISMRNTLLTDENLSGFTALIGVQAYPLESLSAITFPTNITSAATSTWSFQSTQLTDLDFSVMGPNFGGAIDLFNNTSLTATTFPGCLDSVSSIFIRGNGFSSNDALDLSPLSGIAGSVTVRNQGHGQLLFGPSSRSVTLMFVRNNVNVPYMDFSMLDNVNTQFWVYINESLTGVTLGNWTSDISQFYMFGNSALPSLDMSMVSGMSGTILLHDNTSLTATTFPTITSTLSELRFYNCIQHGYLDMKPLSGCTGDGITINFNDNNSWDAGISNHTLHDLDNFGWINGTLQMSGSTSGYDTTSGGYNGFTHYSNLVTKGWTITMSGLTS